MLLFIVDLLSGFGFGQQVTIAAVAIIVALYLFRTKSAAGRAVGVAGTMWLVTVAISLTFAVAVLLGWIDPNPVAFIEDGYFAFEKGMQYVFGPVYDWVMGYV